MTPLMPKQYCNQSITLRLLEGKDKWQKPIFSEPIIIKHMIFQSQTVYSGSNNNRQVVANAIAFLFGGVSDPMPVINKKHVGSEIDFEGETYTITTIIDNRNPYSNEVYSYELEVL